MAKPYQARAIEMITASYDRIGDVLYVTLGEPKRAYGDEQAEGLLVRRSYEDDSPCGVTVFSFSEIWRGRTDLLASRIARFTAVPADDVKAAITSIERMA